MSGRAYTMRELKGIVDYIKERKAYGETKGRKMWVDFANSNNTTRTWQSLKETFLKRILPDLHNPYYRLTSDEMRSFRTGSNLKSSDRKLEVYSSDVSEVPSHTDREKKRQKATPNYNVDVGNATGEEPITKNTDVRRTSIETVVLESNNEPCYNSTEDIIRDLESPVKEILPDSLEPAKSMRDIFTYSEPLTPMIQEIVHDFESDDSNAGNNKLSDHNKNPSENFLDGSGQDNKSDNTEKHQHRKKLQHRIEKSHKKQKPAKNMRIENALEEVKSIINENGNLKENKAKTPKINVSLTNDNNKSQPQHSDNLKQSNSVTVENSQNGHTDFTNSSIPNNQEELIKNKSVKELETLVLSSESDFSETFKNTTTKIGSEKNCVNQESEQKISKKINKISDNVSATVVKEDKNENNNAKITDKKQVPAAGNKKLQVNGEQHIEPIVKIINNHTDANEDLSSQNIHDVKEQESDSNKKAHEQITTEKYDKEKDSNHSRLANPCLQSASLYVEGKSKPSFTENRGFSPEKNVVLLDSHSESDTSSALNASPYRRKEQNSKVLAKVFGFSNGAGNHKAERRVISSTISDTNEYTESISSDSSRWTSDDEIEFVASPRKSRYSRKYVNPGSCKIVPLENEGGLVIAYKGKIYPLIKEERSIKGRELKYMSYARNKNAEDGAAYWRNKYFEEKKKAQELSSKLISKKRSSKIIRKSTSVETKESDQNVPHIPDHVIVDRTVQDIEKVVQKKEDDKDDKAVKIKIHSNNKEVAIEGQWQNMAPILQNIMHLFDKEPPVKTNDASGEDVKEKISRMEADIFREIEEIEKSTPGNIRRSVSSTKSLPDIKALPSTTTQPEDHFEANTNAEQKSETGNVANRRKRGRPSKKEETIGNDKVDQPPVKKKIYKQSNRESEDEIIVNEEKLQLVEDIAEVNKKVTLRKQTNIGRTKTLQRKPLLIDSDDSTVGYKFPSPERKTIKKSVSKKGVPRTPKKVKKIYDSENPTQNFSSVMLLNESSQISTESSYGYQDSDCSPGLILRKRRFHFLTHKNKIRFEARRKSLRRQKLKCYNSSTSGSNMSYSSISLQKSNASYLNTATYKTDSYQLLWTKKDKPSFKGSLQSIMEVTAPPIDEFTKELNTLNLSPAPQIIIERDHKNSFMHECDGPKDSSKTKTDTGNSSNVSLPPSPELSIVENILVERSEILNVDVHATPNDLQTNSLPNDTSLHMSIVAKESGTSDPLMDQDLDFTTNRVEVCLDVDNEGVINNQSYAMASTNNNTVHMETIQSPNLATTVSDSLINEIRTVKIDDVSETLNQKLNNLLLESVKKNQKPRGQSMPCNEERTTSSGLSEEKGKKYRKRCSTPHKKNKRKKSMLETIEPVIEEHMEHYALKIRKSCSPSIMLNNKQFDIEDAMPVNVNQSAKKRRQKEIIKVKILKPKKKCDKLSLHSDSGINNSETTAVFESVLNDSVDLIHNHSDTCLNTNDCLQNNSMVIIENSAQNVISLISDESGVDDSQEIPEKNLTSNYFPSDAQNGSVSCNVDNEIRDSESFPKAAHKITSANSENAYLVNSPLSCNSLITEDLSDETPTSTVSKWCLLSDDESTNMNSTEKINYRPYLEKLFPVTCAVPDLSTITEASREADASKDAESKSVNTANCQQPNENGDVANEEEFYTCHPN